MPTYYSPSGNPEVWATKPAGYFTPEEWEAKQAPIREAEAKKAEAERLAAFYADLPAAKATITDKIDADTSSSILAGFDYTHNGETLHFSYDIFDQQNFADTANSCLLLKMNNSDNDKTITWNAYNKDNSLVRLDLSANEFLDLYNSALDNKKKLMMLAGQRKALVRDAKSSDELKSLVKEWNINL